MQNGWTSRNYLILTRPKPDRAVYHVGRELYVEYAFNAVQCLLFGRLGMWWPAPRDLPLWYIRLVQWWLSTAQGKPSIRAHSIITCSPISAQNQQRKTRFQTLYPYFRVSQRALAGACICLMPLNSPTATRTHISHIQWAVPLRWLCRPQRPLSRALAGNSVSIVQVEACSGPT